MKCCLLRKRILKFCEIPAQPVVLLHNSNNIREFVICAVSHAEGQRTSFIFDNFFWSKIPVSKNGGPGSLFCSVTVTRRARFLVHGS